MCFTSHTSSPHTHKGGGGEGGGGSPENFVAGFTAPSPAIIPLYLELSVAISPVLCGELQCKMSCECALSENSLFIISL